MTTITKPAPPASIENLDAAARCLGLPPGSITPATVDRFWENAAVAGSDECWQWQFDTQGNGYPLFRVGSPDLWVFAHRFALAITTASLSDEKPLALHSCRKNPGCVNPSHLYAGDHADNARDAIADGWKAGVRRFSDADLYAMRSLFEELVHDGISSFTAQREVARRFGLSAGYALAIVRGRTKRGRDLGFDRLPRPTRRTVAV